MQQEQTADKEIVLKLLNSINTLALDHEKNVPSPVLINEARLIKQLCDNYIQKLEQKAYNK